MKRRLLGDIHGDMGVYQQFIDTSGDLPTIQVGDFGMGFVDPTTLVGWNPNQHRFIRGNHDDPLKCRMSANWIPDGTIEDKVMYIGGAWSIDRAFRTEGLDWWADEELSTEELSLLIEKAEIYKPEVMITHDCPQGIAVPLFDAKPINTPTQQALEIIRKYVKPKLWIFGHWHITKSVAIEGTTFICLGINTAIDIDF